MRMPTVASSAGLNPQSHAGDDPAAGDIGKGLRDPWLTLSGQRIGNQRTAKPKMDFFSSPPQPQIA